MWTFRQSSGALLDATGKCVATGYSGHGVGLNDGAMQNVVGIGPIPRGLWSIAPPRDTPAHGPYVLPLIPHADTDCCGRDGFLIHGDEVAHAGEHLASEGCIILDLATREAVWNSGDHVLQVTA
jgi:hypothetical protein